ncbi:MAG: GYD domain protein [Gammaproteobacteria bacterium]|nr:GYD domain protein [Gammaproteobacteria bacterium]|tara:strand:+ start:624 stop:884 length:261 start_codon:yes stop_codon:yes gene_type:complete
MAKYMVQGSYTNEGLTSLLKDDGVKRRKVVVNSVSELGGTLESYYFAFGENGFYLIADMPDNLSVTSLSLFSNSTGMINTSVIVLI